MFLRTAAFAAILVLGGAAANAQQFAPGEPSPSGRIVTVRTVAAVNLRGGPGTQYRVLIQIPRGVSVALLGCVPNFAWCRTSYRGNTGWVSAAYLYPRPGARAFPPGFPFPLGIPFPPGIPLPTPQPPPQTGTLTITGTLTREGVECPAMRGDNGRLYTLSGNTGRFPPGTHVRVTGTVAQISYCQQGTTISVRTIAGG